MSFAVPIAQARRIKRWPSVNVIILVANTSFEGAQMDYLLNDPRLPDPDPDPDLEPKYPPPGPDPDEGDWNIDDPITPPLQPMHA